VLFGAEPAAAGVVLRSAVERGTVSSFRPVRPTLGEIFRDIVVGDPDAAKDGKPGREGVPGRDGKHGQDGKHGRDGVQRDDDESSNDDQKGAAA
jgi:hypothetical protein